MSNARCRCPYLYGVLLIIARGINWDFPVSLAKAKGGNMNKKKEIDKLARLTILNNFISSKLKEQKNLVKSFVTSV